MSDAPRLSDWPPLEAGRAPAGKALLDWAADDSASRLCLITGSAGAGKSHLLAWFASRAAWHAQSRIHALVPAEGMTTKPFVWELSRQLGWGARSVSELLAHASVDKRPLLIAVPDLHAAASSIPHSPTPVATDIIQPLLTLPWVRVIGEIRSPSATDFGIEPATIDLDDTHMTDADAYADWYTRLLNANRTHTVFRAQDVFPHPGLAQLAARIQGPTDCAGDAPVPVTQRVCAAWWAALDLAARRALRTLAMTHQHIGLATWRLLHAGLHPDDPAAAFAVDAAARHLAPQQQVFRLPHPHLAELALNDGNQAETVPTPQQIADVLLSLVPKSPRSVPDWEHAPRYVLDHLAEHARSTSTAAHLLSDPGFLIHAAPASITEVLDDPAIPAPPSLRAAWYPAAPTLSRGIADAPKRAAVLHASALATDPRLAQLLAPAAERDYLTARWSRIHPATPTPGPSLPGTAWPGAISALTVSIGAPDSPHQDLLLAADPIGQLRTLDASTGTAVGRLTNAPSTPATGLAQLTDSTLLLLDPTGTLHQLSHTDRQPCAVPTPAILAHHNRLDPTDHPSITCLNGDPRAGLLVLGDEAGTAHLWNTLENIPTASTANTAKLSDIPLSAITCLRLRNDNVVLIIGAAANGSLHLWGPPEHPMPTPLLQREALPTALASANTPWGPVLAVAWSDLTLQLLLLGTSRTHTTWSNHDITALALTDHGLLTAAGAEALTGWQLNLESL